MDERRAYPRAVTELTATLWREAQPLGVRLENISLNGMFIAPGEPTDLHEGDSVRLEITNPEGTHTIDLPGTVARVTEKGMGIHVESFAMDSFLDWRRLVQEALDSQ